MKRLMSLVLTLSLLIGSLAAVPARAESEEDASANAAAAAAAIGAVIIGIAAIKAHEDHEDRKRHDHDRDRDHAYHGRYRYRDDYQRHPDRPPRWHPREGVTCYRQVRQCYQEGVGYSARWTRREFF